jgi:hypothetical protein
MPEPVNTLTANTIPMIVGNKLKAFLTPLLAPSKKVSKQSTFLITPNNRIIKI